MVKIAGWILRLECLESAQLRAAPRECFLVGLFADLTSKLNLALDSSRNFNLSRRATNCWPGMALDYETIAERRDIELRAKDITPHPMNEVDGVVEPPRCGPETECRGEVYRVHIRRIVDRRQEG